MSDLSQLAAPAAAILPLDDDQLVVLADKVDAEWDKLGEACKLYNVAEGKLWDWKRLNPLATESEIREFQAQCGYDYAYGLQCAASDEMHDAPDTAYTMPARSLRGMIAKARAADRILRQDSDVHSVRGTEEDWFWSLVTDLLALERRTQ
jgi:hypothetical protein